ncbi:MAG: hypothetical protein ACKVGZ_12550, partial [Alphaproteobacteria bacterium]
MTKTASASMPAALKGLGLTKFLLFAAGCVLVGQLVLPPERAELVFLLLVPWLAAWALNIVLARRKARYATYLVPVIFGASLLFLWQTIVRGFDVP